MDPTSIERTQTLLERGPITFVAALFVCAFVLTFVGWLRAERRHAKELGKLNLESRELHVQVALTMERLLGVTEDVRLLAFEARKRAERASRRLGNGSPSPETEDE